MGRIRVLVAEDSLTVRKWLVEILASDPELEVIGDVENGKQAIEFCRSLKPDVITMDIVMPVMTGLAATEYIMAYQPTPILIVSASMNRGEVFKTYDALAAGAVDVLEKPVNPDQNSLWEQTFIQAVKMTSRIKVIMHPRGRLSAAPRPVSTRTPLPPSQVADENFDYQVVAIGASTGGPGAIQEIVQALPETFPLSILFVMHIGDPFGRIFAEWLDGQAPIPVVTARHGEPLPPRGDPRIIVAPPGRHLIVHEGKLQLTLEAERHSCRPSIDILFESVAREFGPEAIGCLLTGMGRDGASGLLAMKQAGAMTLAQDEKTSVVFGMPKEAIALSAAERILPLQEVAPTLVSLAAHSTQRRGALEPAS